MQIKIFIDSKSKRVILGIKGLKNVTERAIRKAFYDIGKDLVAESERLILEGPKTGRLYRLKIDGKTILHRASAPGEAPANLTGALRSSLDFNVVGSSRLEFGAREKFLNKGGIPINLKTRKGVVYAKRLEEGDEKIAKRPFLIRSIKTNYRNIQQHFEEQIKINVKEDAIL